MFKKRRSKKAYKAISSAISTDTSNQAVPAPPAPGSEPYVCIDYPYLNIPQWRHDNIRVVKERYKDIEWFYGRMSRPDAEDLLMEGAGHCGFLIRESFTLIGDVILSLKTWDYVRHFQIKVSPSCNFVFGDTQFTELPDLVQYYTVHKLCYADGANGPTRVMYLGTPLKRKKEFKMF